MLLKLQTLAPLLAAVLLIPSAFGVPILVSSGTFNCTTGNSAACAVAESQIKVDVFQVDNQVKFLFTNAGSTASTVYGIYFDDKSGGMLHAITSLTGSSVDFHVNLPHENLPNAPAGFVTDYSATEHYGFDSNGINPGDSLGVWFTPSSITGTLAGLLDNSIKVGAYVVGIPHTDSLLIGDNCVVPTDNVTGVFGFQGEGHDVPGVPEPATWAMMGAGAALIALARIRRCR